MNFWQTLPKPLLGLSPMDGVTDQPFRFITKKYGQPALVYTEFTSTEGVCHGAAKLLRDFLYDETQRPIIGQIYGTTPDFFRQCAIILCQLGFDGIDINMGCPAKNVAHSGAGAGMIRTPQLAVEIIRATQLGVKQWQSGSTVRDCTNITEPIMQEVEKRHACLPPKAQQSQEVPVSVKTRVGYDKPSIQDWIPRLLDTEVAAIALHGRTLKQQYGGLADWELIGQAANLAKNTNTLLLGNGDIKSYEDAQQKIHTYQTDGVLIGRAAMGNPFVFHQTSTASHAQLFNIAFEQAKRYEETYLHEPKYNFLPMRKHLGWYVHDITNASLLRQAIYKINSSQEFINVLEQFGYQIT